MPPCASYRRIHPGSPPGFNFGNGDKIKSSLAARARGKLVDMSVCKPFNRLGHEHGLSIWAVASFAVLSIIAAAAAETWNSLKSSSFFCNGFRHLTPLVGGGG